MNIKKTYIRPTIKVLQMEPSIMVAHSLTSVKFEGLDEEDELQYGDGSNKSGSAWDAW